MGKLIRVVLFLFVIIVASAETNVEMVKVEGGVYNMGSKSGDEKPIHEVVLSNFSIGKYEITQAQFEKIMGYNPSLFKNDKKPVEQMSWYDAIMFCNELSKKEGLEQYYSIGVMEKNGIGNIISAEVKIIGGMGYRLPTEAEWEYAAKGGNKSQGYKYSGSNNIEDVAWYRKNSEGKTHEVGSKNANELSIFDMSGNVLEYCNDWYGRNSYSKSQGVNPTGEENGTEKVERGGSWSDEAITAKVTYRGYGFPYNIYSVIGFRIVKSEK